MHYSGATKVGPSRNLLPTIWIHFYILVSDKYWVQDRKIESQTKEYKKIYKTFKTSEKWLPQESSYLSAK